MPRTPGPLEIRWSSAVAGVALAAVATAAAVGGLAGLGRRLLLRGNAEDDDAGLSAAAALLLQVRVHLAAKANAIYIIKRFFTMVGETMRDDR
jgi:hypothetical protein